MKKWYITLFVLSVSILKIHACEHLEIQNHAYPESHSVLEMQIDETLDEAEIFLFNGNFEEALKKYNMTTHLFLDSSSASIRSVRNSFGKLLAFAGLEAKEEVNHEFERFRHLLNDFSCDACYQNVSDYYAGGKPILGPDKIPISECLDRVEGTERAIVLIIEGLPLKSSVKVLLIFSIQAISDQARNCCIRGGIWKACLQPLIANWRKALDWGKYGIPPDPMWD